MGEISERDDGICVRRVLGESLEGRLGEIRIGAKQRLELRPSGGLARIRGDKRRDANGAVGSKPRKGGKFREPVSYVARAQIVIGQEIVRGQRARVAPFGRLERKTSKRLVSSDLRLDPTHQKRFRR